jgi:chaperonin cofactor prefoldin
MEKLESRIETLVDANSRQQSRIAELEERLESLHRGSNGDGA